MKESIASYIVVGADGQMQLVYVHVSSFEMGHSLSVHSCRHFCQSIAYLVELHHLGMELGYYH